MTKQELVTSLKSIREGDEDFEAQFIWNRAVKTMKHYEEKTNNWKLCADYLYGKDGYYSEDEVIENIRLRINDGNIKEVNQLYRIIDHSSQWTWVYKYVDGDYYTVNKEEVLIRIEKIIKNLSMF